MRIALVALILAVTCQFARADTWRFPPTVTEQTYTFGDVKIVSTTDARQNQRMPSFAVEIFEGGVSRALYRGVGFGQVFAAPSNDFFVGLSNSGIPGTAVIAFDNKGNLRLLAIHDVAAFDYCRRSVTLAREWYDEKDPQVSFDLDGKRGGGAPGIYLRDCRGKTIELLRTVLDAHARARDQEIAREAQQRKR